MTQTSTESNIIHLAKVTFPQKGSHLLLLRKKDATQYTWFEQQSDGSEIESHVTGPNIEEALRLARREWKDNSYRTINCGFRYTLPERDEHGMNALFHQMVASYNSMNGVYFDEELGHNCFVQAASQEALQLMKKLEPVRH